MQPSPSPKRYGIALFAAWSLTLILLPSSARAQAVPHPLKAADTSSPRATLESFTAACEAVYRLGNGENPDSGDVQVAIADQILRCLDLSEQPPAVREDVGKEAAACLKEVLDRIDLPPSRDIPDAELIADNAEPEAYLRWTIPDTEISIAKIAEGEREGEYLFTADTVNRARDFYERIRNVPYRSGATEGFYVRYMYSPGWMIPNSLRWALPNWMHTRIYDQALWQWIGLVVTVIVALVTMLTFYRTGRRLAKNQRKVGVLRYCLTLVFSISAMLVPLLAKYFIVEQLSIRGPAMAITKVSADVVFLVSVIFVLIGAGNRVAEFLISSPSVHPKGIDAQFIRLSCRVVTLTLAIIVFLEGGQYLGIPLTTLVAGAGVGGLAVALAAQDALKNVFGSMMIVLDKPYRVGERIITKNYDGVVEEIGLRSTRIRLLTGHLAAIPNEEMARSDIENVGRRRHIRRSTRLALALDTPPEKAEQAVRIVREILADHEGMEASYPPRVFLDEFNRDSINLRIMYWYHPGDYWKYLAHAEQVNLRILRGFQAEGIRLALPTSRTHLSQDDQQPMELKLTGVDQGQTLE